MCNPRPLITSLNRAITNMYYSLIVVFRTFNKFGAGEAQHASMPREVQATGQPHRPTEDVLLVVLQEWTQPRSCNIRGRYGFPLFQ